MRADGRKVREGLSAIERAIPYIMPKRVDAQNYVTEYVDEEVIRGYIREVRRVKGVRLSRMAVLIAAYYLSARRHPYKRQGGSNDCQGLFGAGRQRVHHQREDQRLD